MGKPCTGAVAFLHPEVQLPELPKLDAWDGEPRTQPAAESGP
jgi:hypothetical protein